MKLSEVENLESRLLFAIPVLTATLTALGDFNGDHKADEVVVRSGSTAGSVSVTIELGTGNGLFIQSASTTVKNFVPTAVTVGDINGDGYADVVMVGTGSNLGVPLLGAITASPNEVVVIDGNGKGGFLAASSAGAAIASSTFSVPSLISTSSAAVGDFDGDKSADIAVLGKTALTATGSATGAVIAGQTAMEVLWDPGKPVATPALKSNVITSPVANNTLIVPSGNPNVNELFAGDLDGDGRTDLVAALSSQTILPVLKLSGTGTTVITTPVRPDLVTVRFPKARTPVVTVGTNPLDAATPTNSVAISTATEQTIGLAALTAGGKMDLVGLRGGIVVYSPYNPKTLAFSTVQVAQSTNAPPGLATATVYVGDIDGDGLPDLLADTANGAYVGHNTPSATANTVLFSWNRVILPPTPV